MNKKAQITFFIVVGLIIILGASILIYIVSQKEEVKLEEIAYPAEVEPVINFITDCVRQSGAEALELLGSQGGYIEIPQAIAIDSTKYLSLDKFNLRKIPYWFSEGKTIMPSVNYMENQVESFVRKDVEKCLGNFKALEEQFKVSVLDKMQVKTTIAEKDILIELSYPLRITAANELREYLVEKFAVKFSVKLRQMHDLASHILFAENKYSYLENTTLSLMIAHPDIPMNGLTVDCRPQQWYLKDIKEDIQDILKTAIPKIRIENTNYPPFIESERFYEGLGQIKEKLERDQREGSLACFVKGDKSCKKLEESKYYPDYTPADAWEYTHLFYDVNAEPSNLKVSFQYYPEMGMDIYADPSRNGVLSTSLMKGPRKYLSMLCVNSYHFVYTLNYPVKVSIRDDNAFDNKGYIFNYAFPVLIYDNLIKRENYGIMKIPSFAPLDFCSELGKEYYDIRAEGYVEEELPPMSLGDVAVSYNCGKKYCSLGRTSALGGEYKLRTRLPEGCNVPYIEAEKEGYLKNGAYLTSDILSIPLKKLSRLNYEVVKHPYTSQDGILRTEQRLSMDKNDKVMVYMRTAGEEHDQFKEYPCTECTIDFVDENAKYDIDIFLERGGKIIGGYSAKELQIPSQEIGGKQTVVFHIYEFTPYPASEEEQIKQAEYFSSQAYVTALRPEFK